MSKKHSLIFAPKPFFTIVTAIVLTVNTISVSAMTLSERLHQNQNVDDTVYIADDLPYYESVFNKYCENNYSSAVLENDIILNSSNIITPSVSIIENYKGFNNVLDWQENIETIQWNFNAPCDGLYAINVTYMAGIGTTNIVRQLEIDGKSPFSEAQKINFLRQWESNGEIRKNVYGDELSPTMTQAYNWQTVTVCDSEGLYKEPFVFYLEKGKHTFGMRYLNAPMYIYQIAFTSPEIIKDYKTVYNEYKSNQYFNLEVIPSRTEAENIQYGNFSSIRMKSDNDPSVYPLSRGTVKMNSMGGNSWLVGNSTVSWKFNVEKTGLYKLNFRCKNNFDSGIPSYRSIAIDGKIPFKEWESYAFKYSNRWRSQVVSDQNENPYALYLEKGDHTLTMSVRADDLARVVRTLEKDTKVLSALYLNIVMITGQNPDSNYDYKIDEKIPSLVSEIEGLINNMDSCMDIIKNISGEKSSICEQLKQMKAELQALIADTFYIPSKISDITNIISEYGDYVSSIKEFPLALDYFEWLPLDEEVEDYKSSFIEKVSTI